MQNKSKILFIDHDHNLTGSTISLLYILAGMKKANFNLSVATVKSGEKLKIFNQLEIKVIELHRHLSLPFHFSEQRKFFSLKGIYSTFLMIIRFFSGMKIAVNIIKNEKPDLIYLNEYSMLQFAVAAKKNKIPVVTHIRSQFRKDYLQKIIQKLFKNYIDHSICITNIEKEQIKYSQRTVVYEFLDAKNFSDCPAEIIELREKLTLPANKLILLFLGGLTEFKGTKDLLLAYSKILESSDKYFLIIGGYKKSLSKSVNLYEQECLNLIGRFADKNYKFVEHIENVDEYLCASDLLISTNSESHFSRPIIEAWAKRRIVVASRTKHNEEIAADNFELFYYDSGNYNNLAEIILNIKNSDEKLNKMKENAYQLAFEKFNSEKNINSIINIIQSLVD